LNAPDHGVAPGTGIAPGTATGIAPTPLWLDAAPAPPRLQHELPTEVDVLIVGGGYTGLSAARETALAGLRTLVLDAVSIGTGCSSRNGGQVAYSIKPSYAQLARRHGAERAFGICSEALNAIAHLRRLATEEGVDCGWQPTGGFVGAHTPRHFKALVAEAQNQPRGLEQRVTIVPRSEQRREIATDYYHGGCVYEDDASIDPRRLLLALLARALAAGATVVDGCAVTSLAARGGGFEAQTGRGVVRARKLLLATNGYSGPLSPWHRRRIIPIGSYQIATVRLGRERVRDLLPGGRHISDTRRVVVYYRASPDGERIVFGGRASLDERDPLVCVPRLRTMLRAVFPQLADVPVSHAWAGWVGYTFDKLPHLGQNDGVHYSMGYCGQGVVLAPYLGMRIGQQMADRPEGRTAFDGLAFPSRPFYAGVPWFLAPSVFAYRVLDAAGL
jgi:glycine/D-amino acid oxidase-like deaminating enzyme